MAIGGSATEGLQDFDEHGGYRGWADRLAEHIATAQHTPIEYANLAIRSLRLHEIRTGQFDHALNLEPDLMSIVGGVNDVLAPRPDYAQLAADFNAMFRTATSRGISVCTFLMPDPTTLNPLGRYVRPRMQALNDLTRTAAVRAGVAYLDLTDHPVALDPRVWYEDWIHANWLGHRQMAAGMADLLGLPGFQGWDAPLPGHPPQLHALGRLGTEIDWAIRWLVPWVGRGVARVPRGRGVTAKRPVPGVITPAGVDA